MGPRMTIGVGLAVACCLSIAFSIAWLLSLKDIAKTIERNTIGQHYTKAVAFLKSIGVTSIYVLKQGNTQTMQIDDPNANYLITDTNGIVVKVEPESASTTVLHHDGIIMVAMSSSV